MGWMGVGFVQYKQIGEDEGKESMDFLDNILKELREVRKVQKWSQISQILEHEFQIKGKNGKRCRERYQNHLNESVKREEWTAAEEKRLLELHNQKGNRWVDIAKQLERSDNAVKNHYHSRLRKAFRKINKNICQLFKSEFKPLKSNVISRIIQTAEDFYELKHQEDLPTARLCLELKNKILEHADQQEHLDLQQKKQLWTLVKEINHFNRTFKKKNKNISANKHESRYKGKQIKSLIQENGNYPNSSISSFTRKKTNFTQKNEKAEEIQEPVVQLVSSEKGNQEEKRKAFTGTEEHLKHWNSNYPIYQNTTYPLMFVNQFVSMPNNFYLPFAAPMLPNNSFLNYPLWRPSAFQTYGRADFPHQQEREELREKESIDKE